MGKDLQGLLPSPVFANENRCFEDSLGEEGMALSCSEDGCFPVLQFLCTQDVCRRDGNSKTVPEGHRSGNILLAEEPKKIQSYD